MPEAPRAHVVVHQVVAEFAAAVTKTIGKFRGRGVQQNARGLQCCGAYRKTMRALNSNALFGLGIDHANAGNFARRRIKNQAVHHAVRADRELAGFHGRGQRGVQAAEIGLRDAAAMADAAVVASGAAFVNACQHRRATDGHDAIVEVFG